MKARNIILFVGATFFGLSIFLVYYMNVTGAYRAVQYPFIICFAAGLILLFIGSGVHLSAIEAKKRAHMAKERAHVEQEKRERERAYLLQRIRNLEEAKNFEAAASIYERLGMFKEAGRVREKSRVFKVTKTEISVNLNSLLQQLRDGGIVVVYRCPHCNAPLKIGKDTNVESLRVCEHCGSEIEAVDVAEFLRTALF